MTPIVRLVAKDYERFTGIGRYANILTEHLQARGVDAALITPAYPLPGFTAELAKRFGYDLTAFFKSYPFSIDAPNDAVIHLTTQSLATIFAFKRQPRSVITVHDILPYILRDTPGFSHYRHALERWFDIWAMRSLGRACRLIADSEYTKQTLIEHLRLPADQIDVVYLGIDHTIFQHRPIQTGIIEQQKLARENGEQYILYVGSEAPRKNLATLIRAFGALYKTMPRLRLIKVGKAQHEAQRAPLLALMDELHMRDAVIFIDRVSDDELVDLYNFVDVSVQPSLYEGFGFPVLEAMACGAPVVCADASSLPELAGDAALRFEPRSVDALVEVLKSLLNSEAERAELRQRGLVQAAQFTWERTADQTLAVYERL